MKQKIRPSRIATPSRRGTRHAALAVAALGLLLAGSLQASGLCDDVRLLEDARTSLNPATGFFEGELRLSIDGVERTVLSETHVLGIVSAAADGTLTSRTSHRWRLGERFGRVVTVDENFLTPTETPGVYGFAGQLSVETGTHYRCGLIVANGTIDLVGLTLDLPAFDANGLPATAGRLCRCAGQR